MSSTLFLEKEWKDTVNNLRHTHPKPQCTTCGFKSSSCYLSKEDYHESSSLDYKHDMLKYIKL